MKQCSGHRRQINRRNLAKTGNAGRAALLQAFAGVALGVGLLAAPGISWGTPSLAWQQGLLSEGSTSGSEAAEQASESPPTNGSPSTGSPYSPEEGIPILPDANRNALRREVTTIALMFIMGIGCTILAVLAIWMLQRNNSPQDRRSTVDDEQETENRP